MKILCDEPNFFVVDDFCPPKMFESIQRWAYSQKMKADKNCRVFGDRRVSKYFDAPKSGPEMESFFKRLADYPGFSLRFLKNLAKVEYMIATNGPGSEVAYHYDNDVRGTMIFYVHTEWAENWGGELLIKANDKSFNGVFLDPIPNRLVLINGRVKHAVKPVEECSEFDRSAIIGYVQ